MLSRLLSPGRSAGGAGGSCHCSPVSTPLSSLSLSVHTGNGGGSEQHWGRARSSPARLSRGTELSGALLEGAGCGQRFPIHSLGVQGQLSIPSCSFGTRCNSWCPGGVLGLSWVTHSLDFSSAFELWGRLRARDHCAAPIPARGAARWAEADHVACDCLGSLPCANALQHGEVLALPARGWLGQALSCFGTSTSPGRAWGENRQWEHKGCMFPWLPQFPHTLSIGS